MWGLSMIPIDGTSNFAVLDLTFEVVLNVAWKTWRAAQFEHLDTRWAPYVWSRTRAQL